MSNRFISVRELILGFLLWLAVAFLVAESRWNRLYEKPVLATDEAVDLYLAEPVNADGLEKALEKQGLLSRREEFRWALKTLHWSNFREGHYRFSPQTSYEELFTRLGRGLQDPIRLTILPGQTRNRIVRSVSEAFRFDSTALKKTLTDSSFLAEARVDTQNVIGQLYPATYDFYWTASPRSVINRLLKTFEENIISQYEQRFKELDKSVNEIITMASIIEWEATLESEKDTISGLYWNRLEKGMKLQADPTINYAVGERRRLLYEDYKIDHPYNTYVHAGLPPGPITNPSKGSIEAALFPESHDYLYMVASPEGNHNFSETYSEHQRKSAEWRRWLEKQYRIKREQERESSTN
ncbi:endolytic transglycosylase MltG [Fodinibius sediminis]|uniref:endolytic transglycosylase MltG n=1 Tax=Fodinibius sediminis TaxID=1214077 RepID=UPI00163D95EC|nr:endolytic transglycosylase MltG [Fodinibius sediminis]